LTAFSRRLRTAVRRSSGTARTCRRTLPGWVRAGWRWREVVAEEGDGDAVCDQRGELEEDAVLRAACAEFAGF